MLKSYCRQLSILALLLVPAAGQARAPLTGPLADYVAAKDESYTWVKRSEGTVLSCKYVELTLTSQNWRGITWKHQLFLLKPSQVNPAAKHAVLLIGGGNWRNELADPATQVKVPGEAQLLAVAAEQMQSPVAILLHVPQQPIFDGKREDQIIAYTFREFLKSEDSTWPLLAPMVKSAVRGMDACQEGMKKEWNLDVQHFTVTGASKRGWTTWLTGAVDDRVVAIAPMVIDMLNMSPQIALQKVSFGELSDEIDDYEGLDMQIDTPRGKALRQIVDPYEYRDRLTQPKLVILGTNDRYWPLDAEKNYWNDLEGEKYLLRIPNNGHGLKDYARIIGGLNAIHQRVVSGKPLPKLDWKFDEAADHVELVVKSDTSPSRVRTWTTSAKTRDFRESQWTSANTANGGDAYTSKLPRPAEGFAALYAEVVFAEDKPEQFSLTTNVRIVPSTTAAAGGNKTVAFLTKADAASAKKLVAALGKVSDRPSVAVLNQAFWPEKRDDVRRSIVEALALSSEGGRAILKWESEKKLPDTVKTTAALALSRSTDAGLRNQAATELPLPAALGAEKFPPLADLMKLKGDATKGQGMFMQAGCVACHQIKGQFINFGPDLSQIGNKLSQDGLFTAVLYPSAAVEHSFGGLSVTTKEGQTAMGYVISETTEELTLRINGGASMPIKKSSIVKKEELKDSLMPPGLAAAIGPQGLADLVAYLQTLK